MKCYIMNKLVENKLCVSCSSFKLVTFDDSIAPIECGFVKRVLNSWNIFSLFFFTHLDLTSDPNE